MRNSIRKELIIIVIVLAILPIGASYFLLSEVINTSLSISFQKKTEKLLADSQGDLKQLKELNPEKNAEYKERFQQIQDLREIYSESSYIQEQLSQSLKTYFFIAISFAILAAVLIAFWFSNRADKLYKTAVTNWLNEQARSRYLTDIAGWQDIAKRLAHELKNMATPLQVLSSALPKLVKTYQGEELEKKVAESCEMMQAELSQLKKMTDSFSQFARLPGVQFEEKCLNQLIGESVSQFTLQWPETSITLTSSLSDNLFAQLDATLFKQSLHNIVLNAIEANPSEKIDVTVVVKRSEDHAVIKIHNTGKVIEESVRKRVFDPYFSTKTGKENMGLGLAIVKKIISEHRGEIECMADNKGTAFVITLPLSDRGTHASQ